MGRERSSSRGHAVRPHTADVVIEAWGPTAAACYEEAVSAFVGVFAGTSRVPSHDAAPFDVGPSRPEELLVLLLEEVLFETEARGRVPVATHVEVHGDHLIGTFTFVPAGDLRVVGSIPKGVSYHDLEFAPVDGTWRCRATVDV